MALQRQAGRRRASQAAGGEEAEVEEEQGAPAAHGGGLPRDALLTVTLCRLRGAGGVGRGAMPHGRTK